MGLVFRARHLRTGALAALKLLPAGWKQKPDAVARFLRGAAAVSELNHRNICRVHEVGQTDSGSAYVAMDFCAGESLKQRVAGGPLAFRDAIHLVAQVAAGLEVAHAAGIIHRDIKPANLMLGEGNVVKIVDFGLAKLQGQIDITRSGSWVGTPAYMAPEQMTGEPVDQRCDLWALGATLYELLTGRAPFRGDSPAAVVYSVLHDEPTPLTTLRPGVPFEIDRVVRRSLARDPERRYATAHALRADLLSYWSRLASRCARAALSAAPA